MKDREAVARFIENQLGPTFECSLEKGNFVHYGKQELRELLDFIYDSKPLTDDQKIGKSGL